MGSIHPATLNLIDPEAFNSGVLGVLAVAVVFLFSPEQSAASRLQSLGGISPDVLNDCDGCQNPVKRGETRPWVVLGQKK